MVFLKAWERLDTFTPQDDRGRGFSAWLYRMAHNTVVDHYRRSRDHAPLPEWHDSDALVGSGDQMVDPERSAERESEVDRLRAALSELSEDEQQIILLRFVEDLPHAQTAEILGQSEVGSRVLQHRALRKLRDTLTRQGEGR